MTITLPENLKDAHDWLAEELDKHTRAFHGQATTFTMFRSRADELLQQMRLAVTTLEALRAHRDSLMKCPCCRQPVTDLTGDPRFSHTQGVKDAD